MENLTLSELPKYLINENSAWELLERLRWPNGEVVCPHCGVVSESHYFIACRSGERKPAKGTATYRRLWRCRDCKQQFSVLVRTIFESSKVPVSKWLLAMWLTAAGKNGVSALEIQRHIEVRYQTAWHMSHRLREARTREPLAALWTGTVATDETRVGGEPKNRHAKNRAGGKQRKTDKTPVIALVHKETGQAEPRSCPMSKARILRRC